MVVLLVIVVRAFFNLKKDDNRAATKALEKLAAEDEREDAAELKNDY
ncbi:hypothetical protein GCM10019996_20970 [Lentilactobacillus parakefiri]